jgi:hypothetical protein
MIRFSVDIDVLVSEDELVWFLITSSIESSESEEQSCIGQFENI